MTLPAAVSHIEYIGNTVTTVFVYPFQIDIDTELEVRLDGTLQTKDVHYTVTGVASPMGGSVTFGSAPGNNEVVSIRRVVAFEQLLDLVPNSALPAIALEDRMDEIVKMVQLLEEEDSRRPNLLVGTKSAFRYLEFPSPAVPSRLIGTDAAGAGYTTYDLLNTVTSASIDHIGNYSDSLNTAIAAIAGGHTSLFIDKLITLTANVTVPDNVELFFMRQGRIDPDGFTLIINGPVRAGAWGIFGETGTIQFSPKVCVDPVWFSGDGTGTQTDPWTSSDSSGGLIRAFAAIQFEGNLRASPGFYRFSSVTPAEIDVPVNSGDGNITIDMRGAVIQTTSTGTVFKINKNGVLGDTSTNLNTVHWTGGMITTQLPGVAVNDAPIIGTGIDCTRLRNCSISKARFLGLETAINGNVADTLTVRESFFRRTKFAIDFPEVGQPDVPQDIYIENNTSSISNGGTNLDGSYFVRATARVAHLSIARNGIANSTDNSRFVFLNTGGPTGNSESITITENATEQFGTGSKLVEVARFGTTELKNLIITNNQFGSPLDSTGVSPFANGQPALDLNHIEGALIITGNSFSNTAITAVKLDSFRNENGSGPGGVGLIAYNDCPQLASTFGQIFNITNIIGAHTTLTIGRNATVNFYSGGIGTLTYPTQVRFDTADSPTAAIAAAASISISPWDDFVEINGATIITSITATWAGHTVDILFQTADGGMNDGSNLELFADFRARVPNESMIRLRCDGTNWQEISRTTEQLLGGSVAAASTIAVPGYAALVTITGAGDINTITINRNGQMLTLVGGAAVTAVLKDGTGNLALSADFTFGVDDTITILPNNATWFEVARSVN